MMTMHSTNSLSIPVVEKLKSETLKRCIYEGLTEKLGNNYDVNKLLTMDLGQIGQLLISLYNKT